MRASGSQGGNDEFSTLLNLEVTFLEDGCAGLVGAVTASTSNLVPSPFRAEQMRLSSVNKVSACCQEAHPVCRL